MLTYPLEYLSIGLATRETHNIRSIVYIQYYTITLVQVRVLLYYELYVYTFIIYIKHNTAVLRIYLYLYYSEYYTTISHTQQRDDNTQTPIHAPMYCCCTSVAEHNKGIINVTSFLSRSHTHMHALFV